MAYPAVARSLKAFVCRVALYYMARGYHLYAMGYVPERAEPEAIDRKLIEKYGIDITARKRAYRKGSVANFRVKMRCGQLPLSVG
jgi:hypothetical protein